MQKTTNAHVMHIVALMQQTLNSYNKVFVAGEQQVDSMYVDDIMHNTNALLTFVQTKNATQLHNAIMLQDTLVREYFVKTLQYIENNALISANNYCCI